MERDESDAILLVAMRVGSDDLPGSLRRALSLFAEGVAKGVVVEVKPAPLTARHYDELRAAGLHPKNIERDLGLAVTVGA